MSVLPRIAMPEYIARGFPVLKELQSDYQHIVISETPEYGRMLFLDGDLQIAESDEIYHQTMIEPLVRRDALGKVLILGGGDGGVLKAALREGAERAVLVDIDPMVVEMSARYLPRVCEDAFQADNAELVIGDALGYLEQTPPCDGIVYDLTMEPVGADEDRSAFIARVLDNVVDRLTPDGVFSMQCCSEHQPELREELMEALAQRFKQVEDRVVDVPSYGERWVFASAVGPRH